MKLVLKRTALKENYTIGELFINNNYFCDTLEDTVRDFGENGENKIFGLTAIPYGTYQIIINHSNRFNRDMPLLLNVPYFEGVRIHAGNTPENTEGCILVGVNSIKGALTQSAKTFLTLFEMLQNAIKNGEIITIKIE